MCVSEWVSERKDEWKSVWLSGLAGEYISVFEW
jgi:hypothetical protein